MRYPNFDEEKKLCQQGYKIVAGLDEAGRGPLAGPVVAAAVNFKFEISKKRGFFAAAKNPRFLNVNDSKKLSPKKREEIYEILIKHPCVSFGIGVVSEKIIDKINILQATKLAMKKALYNANMRMYANDANKIDYILIDGNFALDVKISQKSIIKGDQKVFSISAASIIAKVHRDKLMKKYHKKYPQYGFDKHKGYGTKAHFVSLQKFGPCKIHRKTFYPINLFD